MGPYWDQAWNPVRGCTPISPGCAHCWAQAMHERFRSEPFNVVTCLPEVLSKPLHWRKPRVVFIDCADLFHEKVPDTFIERAFAVMHLCPQHAFLVLTKRAERMRQWVTTHTMESCLAEWTVNGSTQSERTEAAAMKRMPAGWDWPPSNVWLGVTAEDQQRADERIPLLLATPAARKWVSVEPMLGPIDFLQTGQSMRKRGLYPDGRNIEQVIVGAESGRGMRPCDLAWVRHVAAECAIVQRREDGKGVPCFVKQVHINRRLVTDPADFPPDLRVRDLAWRPTPGQGEG